jgi:hypothetical protein
MSVNAVDFLQAAAHLPSGARLVFYNAAWEDYERLATGFPGVAHRRISYSNGRLEIMSPAGKHEKLKNLLRDLVPILCDEIEKEMISLWLRHDESACSQEGRGSR